MMNLTASIFLCARVYAHAALDFNEAPFDWPGTPYSLRMRLRLKPVLIKTTS
jgi:hypothetical protein